MNIEDARAMVAQMAHGATLTQREAIARHMVAADVCALHAAWHLFGRDRGFACSCTPCLADPPVGAEVVVRILLQGRAVKLTPADNLGA